MERREFLKVAGAAAGGYALSSKTMFAATEGDSKGNTLPRRVLGRTGQEVSIIGFPGLAMIHQGQDECTAALHKAFDEGVNYFDVAPAYGNGDAEVKMGVGLQGIDHSRIFLASKTKERDRKGAREELERSLQRLKTDHFDLYQMHAVFTPEEAQRALGPGGAMETFLKARDEGKIRYFGFSAHTTKGALELLKDPRFDMVMFPINFIEYFQIGFGRAVMDRALEQGVAVVAMKPMCGGTWPPNVQRTRRWWYRPLENDEEIGLALRFALSQRGVVSGVPPAFLDLTEKAIVAGRAFQPVTEAETAKLREMSASCGSVFQKEEERVALGHPLNESLYPDSPHGYCPFSRA